MKEYILFFSMMLNIMFYLALFCVVSSSVTPYLWMKIVVIAFLVLNAIITTKAMFNMFEHRCMKDQCQLDSVGVDRNICSHIFFVLINIYDMKELHIRKTRIIFWKLNAGYFAVTPSITIFYLEKHFEIDIDWFKWGINITRYANN